MAFTEEEKRHWFNSLEKRVSSANVVCEDEQGRLLIVKANYKKYWSLTGGIIDGNETPLEAAIREVYEEVGVKLTADRLKFMYVANRASDFAHSYQFVFKTTITSSEIDSIKLQAEEIDEYVFVTKEDVLNQNSQYVFGLAVKNWANDVTGYCEQILKD